MKTVYGSSTKLRWNSVIVIIPIIALIGVLIVTVGSNLFDDNGISSCPETIYVDKAATGSNNGTSWKDAFTTIQDAWDSLPSIVDCNVTIKVREGTTPYRETVGCSSHLVIGSVTIEGEFYIYGDCEFHSHGAGEIVDIGAFGNVTVGDHIYVYRLGADDRIIDYDVCSVDDISNSPNRIGTDSTKHMHTTDWHYVIVRTEVSGSDDGTDEGTARDKAFSVYGVDKVYIKGFYIDFTDDDCITYNNFGIGQVQYCICENVDDCISAIHTSSLNIKYSYVESDTMAIVSYTQSYVDARYCVVDSNAATYHAALLSGRAACLFYAYGYIADGPRGAISEDTSWIYIYSVTVSSDVDTGLYARLNSSIRKAGVTNNARTPESIASGGVIDN
ncbi:MAG: hypothetical protein JSW38_10350 [Dehalococcoidia bacterium]|nr:MAG: hypothetical protein JSW38_10350 [Dehalococcoidia bacterium]